MMMNLPLIALALAICAINMVAPDTDFEAAWQRRMVKSHCFVQVCRWFILDSFLNEMLGTFSCQRFDLCRIAGPPRLFQSF